AELTRGLIAGASIFYDHDFQIGHSRVSGGLDLQSGFFRFGANYYHPLSEVEDGREGFVEEALTGMDARLVFEREAVRLGSTIGYWDYKGEESGGQEDSRSGWQTSIGLDFGVRILPGVFAEASWERHKDNIVLDERIFAGLAFRFSLPDFEGASYGSGEMTSNLYKIVDREKRILYEEREADNIILTPSGSVVEGGTVTVAIQLREASAEEVVINLVGSGTATYGANGDWLLNNGSGNCSAVTGTSCQITITAGETVPSDNVVITINDDGRTNELAETIILSTVIASGDASLTSRPLMLTIPVDPPLPAVSISATSTNIAEGGNATLTATLTETVTEDVVINLLEGGAADYGTGMDWHLNNGSDCSTATGTSCQITIMAGQTSATATVNVNMDSIFEGSEEEFTVEIDIASPDSMTVIEGSPSSLSFTIPVSTALPTATIAINVSDGASSTINEGGFSVFTVHLSEALTDDVTFNLIADTGSSATYGVSDGDWYIDIGGENCDMASGTNCQVIISEGQTANFNAISINTRSDTTSEGLEMATVFIRVDSGSAHLVELGTPATLTFNIPAN
ncbi:MAG: inverse autotransporter beta domain-containing protein, partial [Hyphomicrobiales bacterium]|nr:inverse autotransporter beta domain-containing protein [Hyphomicrobiales bacterium]